MNLKVGKKYLTKCGNTVTCFRKDEEGFWCRYEKVIVGHEALLDIEDWTKQRWSESGSWLKHPGGIHDIVKAM